ncbi:hypothetical protein ACFFRR_006098 [Megaselia abdita]
MISISSSWPISNNKTWECCATTKESSECPDSEDLIDYEKTVILEKSPSDSSTHCFLRLTCPSLQELQCLGIVCDCPRIELFKGKADEYQRTIYGELEDDFEDVKIYKYEVTSGLCESASLRFLTKDCQITILGLFLGVRKTTNLLSEGSINLENVQNILGNSKLSPSAEKCKDFLQMFMKSGQSSSPSPIDLMPGLQGINLNGNPPLTVTEPPSMTNELKFYVDFKFKEMEHKINKKIDDFERSQNDKLDRILELLERGKSAIKDSDV